MIRLLSEHSGSFKKLEDNVNNLPPFPHAKQTNGSTEVCEYPMEAGKCFAWNLYRSKEVCVDKWFNTAGSKFPAHHHAEREWIIVLEGHMTMIYEKEEKSCGPGEHFYHEANLPHRGVFKKDTTYITVMIPAAEEYPGAAH